MYDRNLLSDKQNTKFQFLCCLTKKQKSGEKNRRFFVIIYHIILKTIFPIFKWLTVLGTVRGFSSKFCRGQGKISRMSCVKSKPVRRITQL